MQLMISIEKPLCLAKIIRFKLQWNLACQPTTICITLACNDFLRKLPVTDLFFSSNDL